MGYSMGAAAHEHHGRIRRRGRDHRHRSTWRPQLPGPRRVDRPGRRPATRHRPGAGPGRRPRSAYHPRFETHLHNDYVTGGLALARVVGAAYHVSAADTVAFDRVPVRDGNVIEVSPVMSVQALATPGHTFTHVSYVLHA